MKKKKGPLILTGVLVILLIVYFGLSSWNKKQDKKEEKETVKVTDLDESTITAIKYQVAAGEMSFEKEGDTWYYSEDKDFPLKQSKPEAIVKAAAQITADRKLEDGDSLDAYGLDDPNYSIEITEEDGTVTTVSFGDSTGTDYYVTVGDTGTVYTVASSVLDDFKTELSDFAQLDEYPSIGSGNLKKEVITENGTTTTYDSENEDQEEEIAAVAGGLGVIIPPSIPFIMYGMASGASVSDLFIAGIIPGVMIGGLLMVYAIYYCKKHGEDQEKKLAMVGKLHDKGLLRVLKDSAFALLSPVIILGCIYTGVASPTEAAVISVFYALIISLFVYKSIKIREIWTIMVEAIRTYAPILFILAASIAFSRVLTLMQVPQEISAWILAHFTNKIVLLLVLNVFLLIVGMVMDTTPAILILTPILLPIVEAVGIHPIHFGIIMVVNLAIGFVTPPIGVNLFVASSLTDVPVMEIAKKAMPMILYFFAALLIVTFVPAVSLALL